MSPPCGGRGLRKCCCCVLDPDYTCYLIGATCIALLAFGGIQFFNPHFTLELFILVFSFLYYFIAGMVLILGTLRMNVTAKYCYCYMMFFGIILVACSMISPVYQMIQNSKPYFLIRLDENMEGYELAVYISFGLHYLLMFFFSIYTPFVVLGNLHTYRLVHD